MRILEPDELEVLADAIYGRYRVMVLAAGSTGLRFDELCGLRAERFDALRKTIRVEESLSEIHGDFIFKGRSPRRRVAPSRYRRFA